MKRIIVIGFSVALLVGCSSGPTSEQIEGTVVARVTALAQAATPYPTYTLAPTYTPRPTFSPYATYTPRPTIAIEVTRIVIVTETPTPTPEFTETPTLPPAQVTATARAEIVKATSTARAEAIGATATAKAESVAADATAQAEADVILKEQRTEGFWLVGIDIAPGLWRNSGTDDNCYWQRSTITGDIIDNHFGLGGGTAYILKSDFQFEARNCGTWTWLSP